MSGTDETEALGVGVGVDSDFEGEELGDEVGAASVFEFEGLGEDFGVDFGFEVDLTHTKRFPTFEQISSPDFVELLLPNFLQVAPRVAAMEGLVVVVIKSITAKMLARNFSSTPVMYSGSQVMNRVNFTISLQIKKFRVQVPSGAPYAS